MPKSRDYSIFNKFNFERKPVGVKFLFFRPKGMEQLAMDKNLSFCEMLAETQQTKTPFYFSKENNETCVGKILLGMAFCPVERKRHSSQHPCRISERIDRIYN